MTERGLDRKAAIIACTVDHIVRFGFEGLRIRDVAKEVGINQSTLIHHFPNKEALVAAVVEDFIRRFSAAKGKPTGATGEEQTRSYMDQVKANMRKTPDIFIVMNELMVRANRDSVIASLIAPSQQSWRSHILSLLTESGLSSADKEIAAGRCMSELLGTSLELSARGLLKLPVLSGMLEAPSAMAAFGGSSECFND